MSKIGSRQIFTAKQTTPNIVHSPYRWTFMGCWRWWKWYSDRSNHFALIRVPLKRLHHAKFNTNGNRPVNHLCLPARGDKGSLAKTTTLTKLFEIPCWRSSSFNLYAIYQFVCQLIWIMLKMMLDRNELGREWYLYVFRVIYLWYSLVVRLRRWGGNDSEPDSRAPALFC